MLQSILAAVFIYHIIKAVVRRRKAPSPKPTPPANAAINHPKAEPMQPYDMFVDRLRPLMRERPWLRHGIELVRKPLALRNILFGGIFLLLGLFLTPFGLFTLVDTLDTASTGDDYFLGCCIMIAIGIITLTAGFLQMKDGLRLLNRGQPRGTAVTGASNYAAPKPQPSRLTKEKGEKQFREL